MNRSIAVDILKVLSMFMIVLNHEFWHGFSHNSHATFNECVIPVSIMETLLGAGVDIFVLITGYFLVQSGLNKQSLNKAFSKGINLWIIVFFYSSSIATLKWLSHRLAIYDAWQYLFPLKKDIYWFMTCYIPLLLLSPFISKLALSLTKRQYLIALAIILLFSTIIQLPYFAEGYSLYWFIALFLIGGYIRRYVSISNIYIYIYVMLAGIAILTMIQWYKMRLSHTYEYTGYLGYYSGPLTVIIAICIFIIFTKVKIKQNHFTGFVVSFAPLTLGIYAIHEHPLIRPLWKHLADYLYIDQLPFVVNWIYIALLVFLFCGAIDCVRRFIFRITRIDRIGNYISNKFLSALPSITELESSSPKNSNK